MSNQILMKPKNWESFQHYKDRSPPWIKLHKALLDDRSFQRLPDASRALAPCLWLLASESKDGVFDGSTEELSFRVRQSEAWVEAAVTPLILNGFFILEQVDSKTIADCLQVAVPETEAEAEAEREAESADKSAAPGKAVRVSRQITLQSYLTECKAVSVKPIPDDHSIRAYCRDAGITIDMQALAWARFREEHTNGTRKGKKYSDWPSAFANSIKDRWYKLWVVASEGEATWTSEGVAARRVAETAVPA